MIFSIVTVCYNNPLELEKTLLSIDHQNFPDTEILVVNGGCHEPIEDVVKKFGSLAITFISEPDKGIYDAMNKGAALAKGQFVIYLNSGDEFHDKAVLYRVSKEICTKPRSKVVYGHSVSDYGYKRVLRKAKLPSDFMKSNFYELGFSHQSIFVARSVLGIKPFNINFKVAADFDFLYPMLRRYNNEILCLDFPVSVFSTGGVSDLDKTILNREKKVIYYKNNSFNAHSMMFFFKINLLERAKRLLRPILRAMDL